MRSSVELRAPSRPRDSAAQTRSPRFSAISVRALVPPQRRRLWRAAMLEASPFSRQRLAHQRLVPKRLHYRLPSWPEPFLKLARPAAGIVSLKPLQLSHRRTASSPFKPFHFRWICQVHRSRQRASGSVSSLPHPGDKGGLNGRRLSIDASTGVHANGCQSPSCCTG